MTDANQDTLKVDLLSTMPTQNQDQKQVDNVDNEQSRHIDECADTSFGVWKILDVNITYVICIKLYNCYNGKISLAVIDISLYLITLI